MDTYLVLGKTGVGKSSFINTTYGEYIAETSQYEACTDVVKHYARNTPWGDLCLIDTPGFAEGDTERDEHYLRLIKQDVDFRNLESAIWVSRLDATRFYADERRAIRSVTRVLGARMWKHVRLVFTFAANVEAGQHERRCHRRGDSLAEFIWGVVQERDRRFTSIEVEMMIIDNEGDEWGNGQELVCPAGWLCGKESDTRAEDRDADYAGRAPPFYPGDKVLLDGKQRGWVSSVKDGYCLVSFYGSGKSMRVRVDRLSLIHR